MKNKKIKKKTIQFSIRSCDLVRIQYLYGKCGVFLRLPVPVVYYSCIDTHHVSGPSSSPLHDDVVAGRLQTSLYFLSSLVLHSSSSSSLPQLSILSILSILTPIAPVPSTQNLSLSLYLDLWACPLDYASFRVSIFCLLPAAPLLSSPCQITEQTKANSSMAASSNSERIDSVAGRQILRSHSGNTNWVGYFGETQLQLPRRVTTASIP